MSSRDQLKAKARELDRGGHVESALARYLELQSVEEGDSSPALWTRIGDLQLQVGQRSAAVESLSRAGLLFNEAGFRNAAIAVYRKVVEADPTQSTTYRLLGEICLLQRYREDARWALGAYARQATKDGLLDEAATELVAYLVRFPDDTPFCRAWAERLQEDDLLENAVEVLLGVSEKLFERGEAATAERVREEIARLRLSADPSPAPPAVRPDRPLPDESGTRSRPPDDLDAGVAASILDSPLDSANADDLEIIPLQGLEPTDAGIRWSDADSAGEPDALPLLDAALQPQEPGRRTPEPAPQGNPLEPLYTPSPDPEELVPMESTEAKVEPLPLLEGSSAEPAVTWSGREMVELLRGITDRKVDPVDPATHYDLGLAFKEMGLPDESIAHLSAALEGGHDPLSTLEILGELLVIRGEHEVAARMLRRAEGTPRAAAAELRGVHYWLGRSEEALGRHAEARRFLERVIEVDPAFRDAAERLRKQSPTF